MGGRRIGSTSIEAIADVYGAQAVVISIDPKRLYLKQRDDCKGKHAVVNLEEGGQGPEGETFCWYQCTVKGGREANDICALTVAKAAEALGTGEIMLNCIDMDDQCTGFDHVLMRAVSSAVNIPLIASSGVGNEQNFVDVFKSTGVQTALAAGMFHRKEVEIEAVKQCMASNCIPSRTEVP